VTPVSWTCIVETLLTGYAARKPCGSARGTW
jgi:hypothetical protein